MIAITRPAACQTAAKTRHVDHHVLAHDPVEAEPLEAELAHHLLDPEGRIEHPLPDEAGHDERHRERIEIDRAQQVFGPHPLVDRDRQQEAERDADRMNSTPKTTRLLTETCQRSLANSASYWRRPTKMELGSIREPVNEIQMVQPVQPT